jgi:hypothetical protein
VMKKLSQNCKGGTRRGLWLLFLTGAKPFKLMEICGKMRCLIIPYC